MICQKISKELIEYNLKYINNYLPVHKPKGVCLFGLNHSIKADLNFVLTKYGINFPPSLPVRYTSFLEPYASGLVTFAFGGAEVRNRNFLYSDYKYRASVEFGIQGMHSQSGELADHLNEKTIEKATENFIGLTIQRSQSTMTLPPLQNHDESELDLEQSYRRINELFMQNEEPKIRMKQKYDFTQPSKEVQCHEIRLLSYEKPLATFEISCQGRFAVRQFIRDLADKLETKASLVELIRLKEGPMWLNDIRVLQVHELNLEYYIHRIEQFHNMYQTHLRPLDHLFNTEGRKRRW